VIIIITWKKAIIFGIAWGIAEGMVSGVFRFMGI